MRSTPKNMRRFLREDSSSQPCHQLHALPSSPPRPHAATPGYPCPCPSLLCRIRSDEVPTPPKASLSMSAFDSQIAVVGTSIGVPSEERLASGVDPSVEVALRIGLTLPFSPAPGEPPVQANAGTLRYKLGKEAAVEFFSKGLEAAQTLPNESRIQTATN